MEFRQAQAEYQRLRGEFESGALTEEALKAQLEELMVQDEQGCWWTMGYDTGQWYRHDGEGWVPDDPPSPLGPQPEPRTVAPVSEPWLSGGLAIIGAALYGATVLAGVFGLFMVWVAVGGCLFIPALFGLLFGPWVGGLAGAVGALVPYYVLTGAVWEGWWAVVIGALAFGVVPGLMVRDPRDWKAVVVAGVAASAVSGVLFTLTLYLLEAGTGSLDVLMLLAPNILWLPLSARGLVGPVRRRGLYWRDRH